MNKNYTLKELADIGAKAAYLHIEGTVMFLADDKVHQPAREAFTKAVLDAIGYEFPKDEEREAFERWLAKQGDGFHPCGDVDKAFAVWRAGREELRRALEIRDARTEQEHAAELEEPAWIPWEGGECPLADTVKRWECKFRGGWTSEFDYIVRGVWHHGGHINDIVAYRLLEG